MKQVMRTGVWLGVLVLSASLGLAQQDFSEVEVSATPVNGAVHMLRANPAAGNIGVSSGNAAFILSAIAQAMDGFLDAYLRVNEPACY